MQTWAIFCRVVDNFGDIGVCWRLARQLATEHPFTVTLWVDDLVSFAKIRPEINSLLDEQTLENVHIRHWPELWPAQIASSDVVIEAFGCDLPAACISAMRLQATPPVWINLEYLSAEDWVCGCHGLPSPQQGLKKYFFFPGFNAQTGGLLAEQKMRQQRAAWTAADAANLRQQLAPNLPMATAETQFISLFAYENNAIADWLNTLKNSSHPIQLFIPESKVLPQVRDYIMQGELHTGQVYQYGAVSIAILPMLSQDDYDQLLWSCDLNFVRGEDSFVRAQWAAKPLVWHIYPQSENSHLEKLAAFLALYLEDLPPAAANAVASFWQAWNEGGDITSSWLCYQTHLETYQKHADEWAMRLTAHGDLTTNLVKFTQSKLK